MLRTVVMSRLSPSMYVFGKGHITNIYNFTAKRGRPAALITIDNDTKKNFTLYFGESVTVLAPLS